LYQDIYALYPYGIAAASLARYELKKTPTKDIAQKVYTMYASGIDTNIESMKKYEGMRIIVPNTYMSKAALYRDLYSYQVVTKEDVVKSYEDAHREIKVQNNKISEQFNLLSYTEFLLSVGEKTKAEELIAAIDGGGVTDMVKKNLSNVKGSKTDYKNIAIFFSSKERSQKFADFFIQFGW
jgi:hypothetical protein